MYVYRYQITVFFQEGLNYCIPGLWLMFREVNTGLQLEARNEPVPRVILAQSYEQRTRDKYVLPNCALWVPQEITRISVG